MGGRDCINVNCDISILDSAISIGKRRHDATDFSTDYWHFLLYVWQNFVLVTLLQNISLRAYIPSA